MNPVLMLCHNALPMTKRAVGSVLAQDIFVDLLCIDNDSADGTYEHLTVNPMLRVHRARPQLGVSKGWNWGLGYFFDQGCTHVLVVNNDVQLRPDTYRELLADGGGFVTGISVDKLEQIEEHFKKSIVPHPDFSCFLIRRSVWETVGNFDDTMKHYASDLDYHLRMHYMGVPAYSIGLPFLHDRSSTLNYSSFPDRIEIQNQAHYDRLRFAQKWGVGVGTDEYYSLFVDSLKKEAEDVQAK